MSTTIDGLFARTWVLAVVLLGGSALFKTGARTPEFEGYLASSAMFPAWAVPGTVRLLILAEFTVAALLVWPATRRYGWYAAAAMMAAFCVFHLSAAWLGDIRACRCLGVALSRDGAVSHWLMLAACLALLAVAGHQIVSAPRGPTFATRAAPFHQESAIDHSHAVCVATGAHTGNGRGGARTDPAS